MKTAYIMRGMPGTDRTIWRLFKVMFFTCLILPTPALAGACAFVMAVIGGRKFAEDGWKWR
jgi:hypothetical protein